ncbi:hypothetical protein Anas_10577, partial [Armadillidium nasatum]
VTFHSLQAYVDPLGSAFLLENIKKEGLEESDSEQENYSDVHNLDPPLEVETILRVDSPKDMTETEEFNVDEVPEVLTNGFHHFMVHSEDLPKECNEEKEFKCPDCSYETKHRSSLRKHKLRHANID